MRSWYERYGVWMALAVFVLISIISFAGFSQTQQLLKMMCSPGDKGDCFRQWVSASSGWFGGAVTLATLIVLSRQMNDMRTHHRETMAHAKLPTYLRAKRVIDAAATAQISLKLIADAVTYAEQNGPTVDSLYTMTAAVTSLRYDLSRPEFDSFENDVGYVGFGSAFGLRTSLQSVVDYGDALADGAKPDPPRQIDASTFDNFKMKVADRRFAEVYLQSISAEAKKFVRDWDSAAEA
ncbi:hypothetical protein GR268_34500 [Rhizobium leguminosarum]|nr:hypothetical protein [Rhizobium leguminosarum]